MSVNKCILIGNLGADPEIRDVSGTRVANFNLATTEKWKDKNGDKQEKTEWHRVVVWGATADVLQKYVVKGDMIYIEGKLQTRKWQDKDGADRYTTEVVVSGFGGVMRMLKTKGTGTGGGNQPPPSNQSPDDDIPF